jgi:hypothetical protein|tara:strand:+ start:58 stop:660 length:603 start_codon:yes stop_codon:yes gene_type:complete
MTAYNAIRYNNAYENVGNLILLSTQTASASASINFTSGINSTYKEYIFYFNNIHPDTRAKNFTFNMSVDTGSNYNVTKTTTYWGAYHKPTNDADYGGPGYAASNDLAQSTAYQILGQNVSDANEGSLSGYLHLFEPSSTTFVKHFVSNTSFQQKSGGGAVYQVNRYIAGYGNTTSAVDAIGFKMSSDNIDAGTIQMFGVI